MQGRIFSVAENVNELSQVILRLWAIDIWRAWDEFEP